MNDKTLEELLALHGLVGAPAASARVSVARSDAGHGLAGGLVSLNEFADGAMDSVAIATDVTSLLDLVVERARIPSSNALLLSARSNAGAPLVVQHQGPAEWQSDEQGVEAYVQLLPGGSAALSAGDLGTLLVSADADGSARVWSFLTPILTVAPFAMLEVSVAQWLQPSSPSWLVELANRADASGDSLRQLCAAGSIHRLGASSDPRAQLAALLSGDGLSAGPLVWAAELTTAQRETLVDLGRVGLESLLDEIDALDDDDLNPAQPEAGDEDAASMAGADLLALLHQRDELEGARVLLAAAGGLSGLELLFGLVDRAGARLLRCLDSAPLPADSRIARLREVMPEAWWAAMPAR